MSSDLAKEDTVQEDTFVLDRVENPHKDLLDLALRARRIAHMMPKHSPMFLPMFMYWQGVLDAMCAATGEKPEDMCSKWLDKYDEPLPVITPKPVPDTLVTIRPRLATA